MVLRAHWNATSTSMRVKRFLEIASVISRVTCLQ